ncbi:hypothetical protein BDD14_0528 [Edaphobacter modestus]|uniref:Uncharacterized protein n=1 Tax=Edaphobacter modestus TaxID=388466 RepID=A0A4Q7YP31_9BACT|nr:hypothetical protein BDD14_0528 [Edaphobacter modestus]
MEGCLAEGTGVVRKMLRKIFLVFTALCSSWNRHCWITCWGAVQLCSGDALGGNLKDIEQLVEEVDLVPHVRLAREALASVYHPRHFKALNRKRRPSSSSESVQRLILRGTRCGCVLASLSVRPSQPSANLEQLLDEHCPASYEGAQQLSLPFITQLQQRVILRHDAECQCDTRRLCRK